MNPPQPEKKASLNVSFVQTKLEVKMSAYSKLFFDPKLFKKRLQCQ